MAFCQGRSRAVFTHDDATLALIDAYVTHGLT